MAEKRVSVRLAAVGGRQVRAELEGGTAEPGDGDGQRPARGVLAAGALAAVAVL